MIGLLVVVVMWVVIMWIVVRELRAWLRERAARMRRLALYFDARVLWRIT